MLEEKRNITEILQPFTDSGTNKRDHFLKKSCIPERFRTETWKSYAEYQKESLPPSVYKSRIRALYFVKKYCDDMENKKPTISKKSIVLIGQSGSGKTSLGSLILRRYLEIASKEVLYVQYSSFKNQASTAYLDDNMKEFKEDYLSPEYLLIDEINEDTYNLKVAALFEDILRIRTDAQKPTILTTKMDLIDFKKYFKDNVYGHITNPNYFHEKIEIETQAEKYDLGEDYKDFVNVQSPIFDGETLGRKIIEIAKTKNTISAKFLLKLLKQNTITKKNKSWSR